ncbi:hypothetical protein N0V83_006783 [Neocucurbitaria cava]|uniref:Uncharacterized protein n=1 Tax=Neocucurbitaria cava TaxID=798079 RepID=A0A9W8Y8P3_9PLEO|nr:hypothetical protein N0V83_006783 [Neocucurbitaria cava]
MTLAFLITLYPLLYPGTTAGFPPDASMTGQSIKQIWTELAASKQTVASPTWGVAQFCHYCETANDHDASSCPVQDTIICQLCSNAVGKKNKSYRDKAAGHQTDRCLFQFNHHVRRFPQWFNELQPSLEDKRTLSRANAVRDYQTIGEVMYLRFFEPGWVGRDDVADEERRLGMEEEMYSDEEAGVGNDKAKGTSSTAGKTDEYSGATEVSRVRQLEEARKEAAEWKAKYEALYNTINSATE